MGLALVLRVLWGILVPVHPVSDSHAYDAFARTIALHGTFGWNADEPFAFWPPGTSAAYAALYRIFGINYGPLVALHIGLGVGIVALSMRLAGRWFGERVAFWTGLLLAVWPSLVMFTTVLASELLFIFLALLALERWTDPRSSPTARGWSSGVLLGLAALVRPIALPLPLVFAASALFAPKANGGGAWGGQLLTMVVAAATMLAVVSPWTWRNYQLYGEVVLVSTNGGITFWMGNTPGTTGAYASVPDWAAKLRDNERSRALGALARQYIAADPAAFMLRSLRKAGQLYGYETIAVTWNEVGITRGWGASLVRPLKLVTTLAWFGILFSALGGVVLVLRGAVQGVAFRALAWPGLTIAFLTLVHAITVSQDRYHLAFAPQIAMFAALGVVWLRERVAGFVRTAPRT